MFACASRTGQGSVWRFNSDGSPDSTFGGGDGRASIPSILPADDTGYVSDQTFAEMAVQPDAGSPSPSLIPYGTRRAA
jgi:hypothetical protein